MTLAELIDFLEKQDQSKVIASGWGEGSAHSYRGYYHELAFEARSNVTIADMLAEAKSALGKEFEGYKGGEYVMGPHTECHLAEYGSCGDELSLRLLEGMCGVGPMIERAIAEAVAAERERIVTLMDKRISRFSEDHRRYIRRTEARGILRDLIHAIRSATK